MYPVSTECIIITIISRILFYVTFEFQGLDKNYWKCIVNKCFTYENE